MNQKCPKCKSKHTVKYGYRITVGKGKRPRRMCQSCGHSFYAREPKKTKGGKV